MAFNVRLPKPDRRVKYQTFRQMDSPSSQGWESASPCHTRRRMTGRSQPVCKVRRYWAQTSIVKGSVCVQKRRSLWGLSGLEISPLAVGRVAYASGPNLGIAKAEASAHAVGERRFLSTHLRALYDGCGGALAGRHDKVKGQPSR